MSYFGDKIRQIRRERRLSQDEMANLAGISRDTLSKWETAEDCPPFIVRICELAKNYNVPPWYFFEPDTDEQTWKAEIYERLRIYEQKQAQAAKLFGLLADTLSNNVNKSVD